MSAPTPSRPSRSQAHGAGDDRINYTSESETDVNQRQGTSEDSKTDFELQQDVRVAITPTARNTSRPISTPVRGYGFSASCTNLRRPPQFRGSAGVRSVDVPRRSASAGSEDAQAFPGVAPADDAIRSANMVDTGERGGVSMHRGVDRDGWGTANMHVSLQQAQPCCCGDVHRCIEHI